MSAKENTVGHMKYKESDHVAYLTNAISQPSLDILPQHFGLSYQQSG
jgi:hypothetical protein